MTKEVIVQAAATDVASLMQPRLNEEDEQEFISLFIRKTSKLLSQKGKLFIGFGPGVAKGEEFFTEDMQSIMQFVKNNTKKKYTFRNGRLLMYFNENEGTGIWEDD